MTFYAASANFLDGTKIEPQRILLAVYPLLYVNLTAARQAPHSLPQVILLHSSMDDTHPITTYASCTFVIMILRLVTENAFLTVTRELKLLQSASNLIVQTAYI